MAKIYCLWLRAEHGGSMLFINPATECNRELVSLVEDGVTDELNSFLEKRLLTDKLVACPLEEEQEGPAEVEPNTGYG